MGVVLLMLVNECLIYHWSCVIYMNMEQKEFETKIQQMRSRLHHEAIRYLMDNDEAEDTVQEAILKLWSIRRDLNKYRSIEALAIVITRRLALNRKRKMVPFIKWNQVEVESIDTPETAFISHEEEEQVMQLIAKLPDTQKTILKMKHIDGLETKEIAHIMGCSEDTVRSNLSRARNRIMKLFMK